MSRRRLLVVLVLLTLVAVYFAFRPSSQETKRPAPARRLVVKESGEAPRKVEAPPESGPSEAPPEQPSIPITSEDPQTLAPGFEHLDKGELPQAEEFFMNRIRLYPLDPEGHYGLGSVYRVEQQFPASLDEFDRTLLLNPEHLQAKLQVAEMLTFDMKEDLETAEELYGEILEKVPQEKSAENGLATVYLSTGRTDEAIHLWEGLQKEMPDQASVNKNLAEAYRVKSSQAEAAGNPEEAAQYLQKAQELTGESPPSPPSGSPRGP